MYLMNYEYTAYSVQQKEMKTIKLVCMYICYISKVQSSV